MKGVLAGIIIMWILFGLAVLYGFFLVWEPMWTLTISVIVGVTAIGALWGYQPDNDDAYHFPD